MTFIEIVLNGRKIKVAARTLADVVAAEDLKGAKVATALNGDFVPEALRATTALNAGDRVEIVSPRQGG
jgi:sulfur carrier protein